MRLENLHTMRSLIQYLLDHWMGRNTKGDLADVVVQQNASFNIQIASLSEVVASNFFHVSIGRKS